MLIACSGRTSRCGTRSGPTGTNSSPPRPRGWRLVARILTPGAPARMPGARSAQAPARCSQLSKDQQEPPAPEVVDEALEHGATRSSFDTESPPHRVGDKPGVAHVRQSHEPDPVAELFAQCPPQLDGEARLPGATRADECHQWAIDHPGGESSQLVFTTDECVERCGEVAGADADSPNGGELRLEAVDQQLAEALRLGEVAQGVCPQVGQRHAIGEDVPHQLGRGSREQDLTAIAGGCDTGGTVDIHPDVAVRPGGPRPGVEPHPHPDRCSVWPLVSRQFALRRHRGKRRTACRWKGGEERISLGAHLGPAPGC